MLIDWFTVAAQIANFAILVWLLKRFLYRPVLDAMAAREKRVRETVAAADRQKAAAEEEANRLREQQDAFEQKKEDLLKKAREEASATRDELLAQARKEADASQAQRRNSLDRDWQEFHAELTQRAQGEALAVARQALRELADVEIEERMVAAFLKKLDRPRRRRQSATPNRGSRVRAPARRAQWLHARGSDSRALAAGVARSVCDQERGAV